MQSESERSELAARYPNLASLMGEAPIADLRSVAAAWTDANEREVGTIQSAWQREKAAGGTRKRYLAVLEANAQELVDSAAERGARVGEAPSNGAIAAGDHSPATEALALDLAMGIATAESKVIGTPNSLTLGATVAQQSERPLTDEELDVKMGIKPMGSVRESTTSLVLG